MNLIADVSELLVEEPVAFSYFLFGEANGAVVRATNEVILYFSVVCSPDHLEFRMPMSPKVCKATTTAAGPPEGGAVRAALGFRLANSGTQ